MMLVSYFRSAARNLLKQKLYTCINVIGMAAGICCFLLIMLYVRQELSYDRHYANADRIHRIALDISPPDTGSTFALSTSAPQVAPLLSGEYAEVEVATRLVDWRTWLQNGDSAPLYRRAAMVDANFFQVFDFQWLAGNAASALSDPGSIVLTASAARDLFGTEDVLGRTLQLADQRDARITGVIADLTAPTHLDFDVLVPIEWARTVYSPNVLQNWGMQVFHTYLLLREGSSIKSLERQFPAFIERRMGEGESSMYSFVTTPLVDLHLSRARRDEITIPSSMSTVRAFIAIAVVVLLVANINFTNLATVRATRRAREVGVRKAIGASRVQVAVQFLGEALLLTTLAVLLGVMAAELLLPAFNSLIRQQLDLDLLSNLWLLPVLMVCVAFISGSYPSFYLASFRAATVLRGQNAGAIGGQWFRKALVTLQFAAAIALLVATWVIHAQLQFARGIELGYEREQVIVLDNIGAEGVGRNWDLLKQRLLANPEILAVTASNSLPSDPVRAGYYFRYDGGASERTLPVMLVDFDYFETYGIGMIAGRSFSRSFSTDVPAVGRGGSFILNEIAVRQLGWTSEEAIGKQVGLTCCGMESGMVVGVAANVQHGSVQAPQGPIVYVIPPEPSELLHQETRLGLRMISIKLSGRDLPRTLAYIDSTWNQLHPEQAMSRTFLEEQLAGLYQNEERQGRVLSAFAIVAILITCMGLYGLSSYDALLRTKEIGVRKVMGSGVWNIVLLLTNDFSKLVLLSNLIAWPIAYFAMQRWLENFAYRIDLTPMVFVGSGAIALCIAWVTVGTIAARAAGQKPVLALRYE